MKKTMHQSNKRGVLSERFKGLDPMTVSKISDSLKDLEFHVTIDLGNEDLNKKQLEKDILELGGSFVQNPTANTHCIVASKMTYNMQQYAKKNIYDIVIFHFICFFFM